MNAFRSRITLFTTSLIVVCALTAKAGVIHLHPEAGVTTGVITLGDIAEFRGFAELETKRLAAVAIRPAPSAGESIVVTSQEVREMLRLHGLESGEVQLRGESRVTKTTAVAPVKQTAGKIAVHSSLPNARTSAYESEEPESVTQAARESHARLERVIQEYLIQLDGGRTQWNVLSLASEQQLTAFDLLAEPIASGGQAPFAGRQVFAIRDLRDARAKAVYVKVDVERMARALVPVRDLEPGEIITEHDVRLDDVNPGLVTNQSVLSAEGAVGKEVTRRLTQGRIIANVSLRNPLVIKRNELVTVYSVAAGIQVKTTAKATADAAAGDLITLVTLEGDKKFQGRATGMQEAMVFVDSPTVAAKTAGGSAARATQRIIGEDRRSR